ILVGQKMRKSKSRRPIATLGFFPKFARRQLPERERLKSEERPWRETKSRGTHRPPAFSPERRSKGPSETTPRPTKLPPGAVFYRRKEMPERPKSERPPRLPSGATIRKTKTRCRRPMSRGNNASRESPRRNRAASGVAKGRRSLRAHPRPEPARGGRER